MNKLSSFNLLPGFFTCITAACMLSSPTIAHAQTIIADQPLLTSIAVPGNLLLSLSVEYPTALSWAYPPSTNPYTPATNYLGYFDPGKCYVYNSSAADDVAVNTNMKGYFQSAGLATNHACTSSSAMSLWSGNWLNWASMQTIDTFRWALTGGYRVIDTTTSTVLERTWASGQGGKDETVNKSITNASYIAGATPFNWSTVTSRVWGTGNQIWVSGVSASSLDSPSGVSASTVFPATGTVAYSGQNSYNSSNLANSSKVYALNARVKVCDTTIGVESNCTAYGSGYKPEGLIQQYSQKIRFGVFGYLNDNSIQRDGGVLRANMKFVGPIQPALPGTTGNLGQIIAGTNTQTNPYAEWSATTGIFATNPNPSDASNSGVTNSGVINYLNKFGEAAKSYKTYDPLSELYYAGVRYYKNLGNWPTYTSNPTASMIDGFPVITSWNDPILYSCQKNFILGIGDRNTHADANLPGSTIGNASFETALRPTDTTVNVQTATNMVGTLEGVSSLGTTLFGDYSSYFMAGLAYDIHTNDMRPNEWANTDGTTPKYYTQTVATYWVDVQENQAYANNNQFYYATKYGGFSVPSGFQPYASTNSKNTLTVKNGAAAATTIPMTNAMWHTNSDTFGSNLRPDNYFSGAQANVMVAGLNSAFASIISNISGSSTTFSFTSGQITSSNNISYASQYNSGNWTGDVVGSSVTYDATGTPAFTSIWDAQSLLATQSTRQIVTCCTGTGAGFPFQTSNVSSNNPTGYATFANVPGVAAGSQSSANYLAYLRGIRALEIGQTNGVYRTRAAVLGDIVDSKVAAAGPPNSAFSESFNPGYTAFKTAYASRKTVVYVGANDGMVHAFDGSNTSTGGAELFAYIPSAVYGNSSTGPVSGLASLGNPTFVHHYLVDGQQQVFDIDMNHTANSSSTTPSWKSVLIGGLGKGGISYYAIDVTDPSTWTSETAVASKVLWEFPKATDTTTVSQMGYSFGPPVVVKTAKYGWVVVFTSGYNNSDGKGYFFFVNPATGALLETVATGVGSTSNPAGLAYASAYVASFSDSTADAIYAGDLLGNVWRIDVTTTTGNYATPTKIAVLKDSSGVTQPVTTRPLIEVQPGTFKRYVLLGTGQLLSTPDLSSTQIQTFYAIVDGTATAFYTATTLPNGVSYPIARSNMVADTNLTSGIGSAPSSPMGWYIDLPTNSVGVAARVVVTPSSTNGMVAFATVTPNGDPCNPSSSGLVYAINIGNGTSVLTNSSGGVVSNISSGTISDVAFLNINGHVRLLTGGQQGVASPVPPLETSVNFKRINWRELPTAD
ncbi:pilus assembly protein [Undibacterium jejuense]|uniref:Pilus assembly protein n=1 Tax=Undibacterium jejuense TaxID=1344949 RepID=A0A923KL24_9BURK|nr:PilC/PilY family type IV pilus protein [Undibacterium jejuense]MBC3862545.1 pilus assembly protein [Undibacterium jejuense]